MTAYRVTYEVRNWDYIIVEADTEDGAWVTAYQEVRRMGNDVEITDIEEA